MSEDSFRQLFTGNGVEAWLTCEGNGCVLDFSIATAPGETLRPRQAEVEVLYQPRDERGMPRDAPVTMFRRTVRLRAQQNLGIGRCWLDDIRPGLARECHYRIRAITVDA